MPSDRPSDGLARDGKRLSARPLVVCRGAAQRRLCRRSRHTTRVLALRCPQTLSAADHRLLRRLTLAPGDWFVFSKEPRPLQDAVLHPIRIQII
jgi:hypothetical protein